MHLPARLRVPLAGLALCSAALLISACGGSSAPMQQDGPGRRRRHRRRRDGAADEAGQLLAQVCVQYKAAKKACPKPGSAERKQLQQSFVAQLVQQAEFDDAGKQLKVAVKQKEIDTNLQKLELQYAKGSNGKVDDAKWKKVLTDNHTTRGDVSRQHQQRAPAAGHLRQADEERHASPTRP